MPWISLDDAKAELNKSATVTVDDTELNGFIGAACAAIEEVKGHVDPYPVNAAVFDSDWRGVVILPELPVDTISTVTHVLGGGMTEDVVKADPVAGVTGWTFDGAAKLTVPGWRWTVAVTYTAGYPDAASVPANIRLAALELVAHLWRGSQLNSGAGRPQYGDTDAVIIPGLANALPYRVRELLGLFGDVVRDEVFIA